MSVIRYTYLAGQYNLIITTCYLPVNNAMIRTVRKTQQPRYSLSSTQSNSVDYIMLILYILFNNLSGMFNERAILDGECIHISNLQICSPFIVCEFSFKFNHTHTRTHARTHTHKCQCLQKNAYCHYNVPLWSH